MTGMDKWLIGVALMVAMMATTGCGISGKALSAKGGLGMPIAVKATHEGSSGQVVVVGKETGLQLANLGLALYLPNSIAELIAYIGGTTPEVVATVLGAMPAANGAVPAD